ncbi:hypothetical protein IFM89_026682 [Coptis chinensis]|uniref:Uncharacterized protein n=1 Tax=Coptis chinensis TaxID=261450 RepID=A0A835GY78_9MAGN|nr:hypothetical protein IFM89_026682 [Coptis chinensis]
MRVPLTEVNAIAIRAFTYAGGKRMMTGPNWQVVKVRVRIRKQCKSLSEDQYKKVLEKNYMDELCFPVDY